MHTGDVDLLELLIQSVTVAAQLLTSPQGRPYSVLAGTIPVAPGLGSFFDMMLWVAVQILMSCVGCSE